MARSSTGSGSTGRAATPSVDDIAADLAELAAPSLASSRPPATTLVGVGVAVVGVVRRSDGVRLDGAEPRLARRARSASALVAALGLDVPISVANDADLGALAELRRGAAVGVDDVLFVSGEVGVGGGIIVDGQPLTGAAGYGGEVGHMPVNPTGPPCRCGSIGCWETEVGERRCCGVAGRPPGGGRAERRRGAGATPRPARRSP